MRFDLITIFPEFFSGPLEHGIVRKAREGGLIEIHVQDLRLFTKDKHRTVDDRPFGGGEGMVLKPEPLFEAVEFLLGDSVGDAAEHLATEEVSIGDFVLSGGELPAALIIDAVTRLLPGALGNEASSQNESFSLLERAEQSEAGALHKALSANRGLLDYPHYTRPSDFRGWKVPEVLIGGNHAEVAKWRRACALEKTRRNRPDLFSL